MTTEYRFQLPLPWNRTYSHLRFYVDTSWERWRPTYGLWLLRRDHGTLDRFLVFGTERHRRIFHFFPLRLFKESKWKI